MHLKINKYILKLLSIFIALSIHRGTLYVCALLWIRFRSCFYILLVLLHIMSTFLKIRKRKVNLASIPWHFINAITGMLIQFKDERRVHVKGKAHTFHNSFKLLQNGFLFWNEMTDSIFHCHLQVLRRRDVVCRLVREDLLVGGRLRVRQKAFDDGKRLRLFDELKPGGGCFRLVGKAEIATATCFFPYIAW